MGLEFTKDYVNGRQGRDTRFSAIEKKTAVVIRRIIDEQCVSDESSDELSALRQEFDELKDKYGHALQDGDGPFWLHLFFEGSYRCWSKFLWEKKRFTEWRADRLTEADVARWEVVKAMGLEEQFMKGCAEDLNRYECSLKQYENKTKRDLKQAGDKKTTLFPIIKLKLFPLVFIRRTFGSVGDWFEVIYDESSFRGRHHKIYFHKQKEHLCGNDEAISIWLLYPRKRGLHEVVTVKGYRQEKYQRHIHPVIVL